MIEIQTAASLSPPKPSTWETSCSHPSKEIGSPIQDLWIASNRGISRLQDDQLKHYTVADGIPSGEVWSIIDDGEGGLFVGTTVVHHDVQRVYRYLDGEMQDMTPANWDYNVQALFQDSSDDVWVGSRDGGMLRWDGCRTSCVPLS